MTTGLHIAFFGSSLVSAYWNGAATYYRGMIRALHERGHRVTFYEPDAYDRQQHRDMDDPDWAEVVVYSSESPAPDDSLAGGGEASSTATRSALMFPATEQRAGVYDVLDEAQQADVIIKASGVGVFDRLLEREIAGMQAEDRLTVFWDVDAPATLDRVQNTPGDAFASLIPKYDLILTYGGGRSVVDAYQALGARDCFPIYNALDETTHYPVASDPRFDSTLVFLGNRLPDREKRVRQFFFEAARQLPDETFLLGGSGWDRNVPKLPNVRVLGHVYTHEHNALNCSARAVLNINRESMARYGYSPATRVFEAAGAGACIITDDWEGIDMFLEPGREILVARDTYELVRQLQMLTDLRARAIGKAARERVLAEHTYAHRAEQVELILRGAAVRGNGLQEG
jgi:spore maturation protein CgeB